MFVIINKTSRQVFATESIEPAAGAYPASVFHIIELPGTLPIGATISQADITTHLWSGVRAKRNRLLAESDKTMLEDYPKQTKKQDWKNYRAALRAITAQPDPESITWPTIPEAFEQSGAPKP